MQIVVATLAPACRLQDPAFLRPGQKADNAEAFLAFRFLGFFSGATKFVFEILFLPVLRFWRFQMFVT